MLPRWLAAGAVCFTLLAAPVCAQETEDRVVITGATSGPKLWRVYDDDSEVFILGAVEPLRANLKWKSTQLNGVSKFATRGLTGEPKVSIDVLQVMKLMFTGGGKVVRNPDKVTLSALLDPKTKARYDAVRQRYGVDEKELERYRPYIAGLALLRRAMDERKLEGGNKIEDEGLSAIRRRGAPVKAVTRLQAKPLIKSLEAMKPGADLECFKAILDTIEGKMGVLETRADAWARGDLATLRATPAPPSGDICFSVLQAGGAPLEALSKQALDDWTATIKAELARPGTTLAVAPIDLFIEEGAVLDRLRADGIAIDGP